MLFTHIENILHLGKLKVNLLFQKEYLDTTNFVHGHVKLTYFNPQPRAMASESVASPDQPHWHAENKKINAIGPPHATVQ